MTPSEINQQLKSEIIRRCTSTINDSNAQERDTLSNSASSSGNNKPRQQKIKIYRQNLERCMKEYNLPADAFEFKDEERLGQIQQSIVEMRKKRLESGKKEFDIFNIR